MALAKMREFTGLAKLAPAAIEARSTETALRSAQYELDMMLHDLRAEFIARPGSCERENWTAREAPVLRKGE